MKTMDRTTPNPVATVSTLRRTPEVVVCPARPFGTRQARVSRQMTKRHHIEVDIGRVIRVLIVECRERG
jgi:hypothetical protein